MYICNRERSKFLEVGWSPFWHYRLGKGMNGAPADAAG